ncbi:hypothetical protein KSP40_PGU002665 [Platanthera guangdongensis]|uniref:Uncharacterized protein n=1 Tax=Platanthera guangdongensis TaxID=2320717 RepID=A0ABR2N441_9ASPA
MAIDEPSMIGAQAISVVAMILSCKAWTAVLSPFSALACKFSPFTVQARCRPRRAKEYVASVKNKRSCFRAMGLRACYLAVPLYIEGILPTLLLAGGFGAHRAAFVKTTHQNARPHKRSSKIKTVSNTLICGMLVHPTAGNLKPCGLCPDDQNAPKKAMKLICSFKLILSLLFYEKPITKPYMHMYINMITDVSLTKRYKVLLEQLNIV